ncbi:MAG: nicotinamide riboside transporter PnuC [Tannerellaceae bacterium]|nr:nicotinamide riboside transporter PnuC [Tannerellaceae bacterium]
MIEYIGASAALLYLLLEIKQHRAMWVVGIFSSLAYVFIFFYSKVYANMGLNLYYVFISLYGFRQWSRRAPEPAGATPEPAIRYTHLGGKLGGILLASLGLMYLFIYYLLKNHTDSAAPAGDAVSTTIGIVATWMLARRIIEHWFFWIVADAFSVYLYYTLQLYPTMLLYFCYTVLAFVGYYTWKQKGVKTDVGTL